MNYHSLFNSTENQALLVVCARKTIRTAAIAGIVWGAIEDCAWEHHHYFSFAELMDLPGASPDLRELLAIRLNVRPLEIALIRFSAPLLLQSTARLLGA